VRPSYGGACAGVKRSRTFALVNPVFALALVAAAGIALTRLPLPRPRGVLSLDVVLAAGAPLVLLGALLGPGLAVLDPEILRAIAPATALGIGWIGAVFAARFEWRFLRRIPARVWGLAALQAAAVLAVTALVAWGLGRAAPSVAAAWRPTLPALLTLAAAATVSEAGVVALVARSRAFGLAAMLDTAFGAGVFAVALALFHPRDFGGAAIAVIRWVAVAGAASAGVGMLFLWLGRLRPDGEELGLDLLGAMLLGAGVGYATDVSPFVVCALATALIVNRAPPPLRRRVQALLETWEPTVYAVFLIIAGALLRIPTVWLLPAVVVLGVARVAARWAPMRLARGSHAGLATVAQGGVALALALSFSLVFGGRGGSAILTTVVLGVALAQALAGPLLALALRPTRFEVT
jgi:hypothetical protein